MMREPSSKVSLSSMRQLIDSNKTRGLFSHSGVPPLIRLGGGQDPVAFPAVAWIEQARGGGSGTPFHSPSRVLTGCCQRKAECQITSGFRRYQA